MSYEQDAIDAAATLAEDGQVVTLHQTVVGAYSTATGAATTTVTDVPRYGAVFDYGDKLIDGTLIVTGDKQLYMEAGTVPNMDDTITVDSVIYGIKSIKEINPAGVPVLYIIQLRV